MTTHELKTWPVAFEMALSGVKMFEIRVNDRNFQVGDTLHLREWNHETVGYTGRELWREVICVVTGWGLPDGMCVLGLQELFGDALSRDAFAHDAAARALRSPALTDAMRALLLDTLTKPGMPFVGVDRVSFGPFFCAWCGGQEPNHKDGCRYVQAVAAVRGAGEKGR